MCIEEVSSICWSCWSLSICSSCSRNSFYGCCWSRSRSSSGSVLHRVVSCGIKRRTPNRVYIYKIYLFIDIQYHSITCIQSIHSFVMFFSCCIIFAIFKRLKNCLACWGFDSDIFFHISVMTLFPGKKFHVRWPVVVSLGLKAGPSLCSLRMTMQQWVILVVQEVPRSCRHVISGAKVWRHPKRLISFRSAVFLCIWISVFFPCMHIHLCKYVEMLICLVRVFCSHQLPSRSVSVGKGVAVCRFLLYIGSIDYKNWKIGLYRLKLNRIESNRIEWIDRYIAG